MVKVVTIIKKVTWLKFVIIISSNHVTCLITYTDLLSRATLHYQKIKKLRPPSSHFIHNNKYFSWMYLILEYNALIIVNIRECSEDNFYLSAPVITALLVHLSSKIPSMWKAVQVLPLHTNGDAGDLNNYQTVYKLFCLSNMSTTSELTTCHHGG